MIDIAAQSERGKRFLERFEEFYDAETLSPGDIEHLQEAVYGIDALEELRAALVGVPLTEQRQGGPRLSPLRTEERLRSQALTQLISRTFPNADDE